MTAQWWSKSCVKACPNVVLSPGVHLKPMPEDLCPVLPGTGEKWWAPGISCHQELPPVPDPQCSCRELLYLGRVQGVTARACFAPMLISTLGSGSGKGKPLRSFTARKIQPSCFSGMSLSNYVNWLITSTMPVSEGRRLLNYTNRRFLPWVSFLVVCIGIYSVFASFWEVTVLWATHSSVLELK